ncbi:MAG: glycosyltransferase [Candidatus Altiarchaeota archaeon]|nr:glycosyltransferase [Candidatus Altiarchaeota archaeon]
MDLHTALVFAVWWIVTYFFIVSSLVFLRERKTLNTIPKPFEAMPQISIVVPAFNEERGIANTIDSLLKINYPRELLELVVVNDGSKDRTAEIIQPYADNGLVTFINNKKNQGKAASLNQGFQAAKGKYVACIDADTIVERNILLKTINYFQDKEVAAVMVRVQVLEPKNWLERIISVEYNLGLGFYPKLISCLDSLYLTPGQFSIYRRNVVLELGGFDRQSIVEDTEIAYRMQKSRMKIACCLAASAYTKVPDNIRDFYYQRKRWYAGTLQTILAHRDVFFNKNLGNFGMFFMPVNYGGILLGMMLFISTLYLAAVNFDAVISRLLLIRFDVRPLISTYFTDFSVDPFRISIFLLLGISPFLMNMIGSYIGLKTVGENVKDNLFGYISFLFFFIPYQILWLVCVYVVLFGKKVKWRALM